MKTGEQKGKQYNLSLLWIKLKNQLSKKIDLSSSTVPKDIVMIMK